MFFKIIYQNGNATDQSLIRVATAGACWWYSEEQKDSSEDLGATENILVLRFWWLGKPGAQSWKIDDLGVLWPMGQWFPPDGLQDNWSNKKKNKFCYG